MNVRESYSRALEQGTLVSPRRRHSHHLTPKVNDALRKSFMQGKANAEERRAILYTNNGKRSVFEFGAQNDVSSTGH